MCYVDTRGWGGGGRREGGKRGPNRPATPPLPRILSANGSAGIWGGGWRWTETDGSWQTHTDSQWIQGSLAERSEQGWIKDRLTFKVSPCLVPPHCQRREKSVYGSSVGFSVKLAGRPRYRPRLYIPHKQIYAVKEKWQHISKWLLALQSPIPGAAHICNSSDILIRSSVSCVPSRRKNQTSSKWTNLVFTPEAQLLCVCVCA